jgi:transcriptional regulator GlxA family with amidase domain
MAQEHWTHPGPGMPLCHEYILLELSLLFLGGTQGSLNHPAKPPSGPIARSLFWFSQRLESDPGLDEVARAVGVSVAHLRRLFHQTFQMSPKSFFDQLRFQRATHLLADPSVKIESISAQCGFGSASAFSRAFKNKFGCSPDFWRTSL